MNTIEFNVELERHGLSVAKLADMVGIGKKALYAKRSGKVNFKQNEIKKIREVLNLSDARTLEIFFDKDVS